MKTNSKFGYATKVWLASWFFTPFFIIVFSVMYEYVATESTLLEIFFPTKGLLRINIIALSVMIYGFSFVMSLPFWLSFWLTVASTQYFEGSLNTKRIYLNSIAIILLLLLFFVTNRFRFEFMDTFPWMISVSAGIWYFKFNPTIRPKRTQVDIEEHLIH